MRLLCRLTTPRRFPARSPARAPPQREKDVSGLADVPGGAKGKLLEVEYAFTEDRKLRGQLRDPAAIEAQVRACRGVAVCLHADARRGAPPPRCVQLAHLVHRVCVCGACAPHTSNKLQT
jgi:hypothetical protein